MPHLREQAAAVLATCKSVVARAGELPEVDPTTFYSALKILQAAQAANPQDKFLAETKLKDKRSWTAIQTAMRLVLQSQPAAKAAAASGPHSTNKVTGY
jgi:hypothetical protein